MRFHLSAAVLVLLGVFGVACGGRVVPTMSLARAVALGDVEQVAANLRAKADPNGTNDAGATLLCVAVSNARVEIAGLLVKAGADVNGPACNGTPLLLCTVLGPHAITQLFLDEGARATAVDASGETALHLAALVGNTPAMAMLIAAGAPIDAKASDGATPLHRAVNGRCLAAIELLYEHGVNRRLTDSLDRTASDLIASGELDSFHPQPTGLPRELSGIHVALHGEPASPEQRLKGLRGFSYSGND